MTLDAVPAAAEFDKSSKPFLHRFERKEENKNTLRLWEMKIQAKVGKVQLTLLFG